MAKAHDSKLAELQLQLDEALQMLQLVAANKRTCLEVEQWLKINFPELNNESNSIIDLLRTNKINDNK